MGVKNVVLTAIVETIVNVRTVNVKRRINEQSIME